MQDFAKGRFNKMRALKKTSFNYKQTTKMKITKFFKLTAAMLACVFAMAITSCDNDDEPKGPELKFNPANVAVAPSATATVTVSGGTAPFTVASSDAKIATAKAENSTITVTGVKEGTATITVTDAKQIKGKFAVTVKNAAAGLDFDKKSVSVAVGKEETVTVKGGTKPFTATAKDTKIATVTVKDDKITIKGVKAGTTSITVTDKDKKTGTISVTVK